MGLNAAKLLVSLYTSCIYSAKQNLMDVALELCKLEWIKERSPLHFATMPIVITQLCHILRHGGAKALAKSDTRIN